MFTYNVIGFLVEFYFNVEIVGPFSYMLVTSTSASLWYSLWTFGNCGLFLGVIIYTIWLYRPINNIMKITTLTQ